VSPKRGRPRGPTTTPAQDWRLIRAVLKVWSSSLAATMRGGDDRQNVFEIVGRRLHRSSSATRKAFDAAWARQCPHERKPNWQSRRAAMRVRLRMLIAIVEPGANPDRRLPRSWREKPYVSPGDRD
jgi:hypothetical protein